ncbi:DUF771 domain-containing protein [Sporolactobacillus sp. CQH2019]|uniref:DUF771 domain-containing protein n=1 Tax=Sporolactobacillus sp. CQH2019 TaxID=3023512 RepID=UPI0023684312|nr:DUF771 domain-containing protein [Sporolactobacillus sp. CQH2019]MDD9148128.1 DUF771 domain-containing protein [Sporolactobacillus sp. CQH2019]
MAEKLWWNMKDLESATGFKRKWLLSNILYRPEYRDQLDIENGGPVYYPDRPGDMWQFLASSMKKFLEIHFAEILRIDHRHQWSRHKEVRTK